MNEIAVVMWEDRHTEPEAYLFSSATSAIEWAKSKGREVYEREPDEELRGHNLTHSMQTSGWIYYAAYGEGDSMWAYMTDVDAEVLP